MWAVPGFKLGIQRLTWPLIYSFGPLGNPYRPLKALCRTLRGLHLYRHFGSSYELQFEKITWGSNRPHGAHMGHLERVIVQGHCGSIQAAQGFECSTQSFIQQFLKLAMAEFVRSKVPEVDEFRKHLGAFVACFLSFLASVNCKWFCLYLCILMSGDPRAMLPGLILSMVIHPEKKLKIKMYIL